MRYLTPWLRVRNCCGAIQAVISQVSRYLRWISWQQQLVSCHLDRQHLLDRHNITPTLLMSTRIYLRVSDGATWNGNVTVVNLVASSRVHRDCVAPSDRGEESMADFHMAVWVWAGRACSNAPVVDGRVFCSGALVTVASPIFRDQASWSTDMFSVFLPAWHATMNSVASAITPGILAWESPSSTRQRWTR